MSPRHDTTPAKRLEVLRLLAIDNYTLRDTATETGLSYTAVADIAEHYGYPETDKMLAAFQRLQDTIDTPEHHTPSPPRPVPTPPPAPSAAPTPVAATAAKDDTDAALLAQAKSSTKARTRALGEKITTLLDQLRAVLEEETRVAANAARIAQLEAELAALKGKPAPTTVKSSGTAPDGPDSKTIRAWAVANGVTCPAVGRVPATVRDAYLAANTEDAA